MAASADGNLIAKASRQYEGELLSGTTLYRASLGAVVTDGTTAAGGRIRPFSSASDRALLGFRDVYPKDRAAGEGADGAAIRAVIADDDGYRFQLAVTGVAGTKDVGKEVFATDDNTFTLTRAANAVSYGTVVEHVSGTTCWVERWTAPALAQKALEAVPLAIPVNISGTAVSVRHQQRMPFAGSLERVEGTVKAALASAGVDVAVTLRIRAAGTTAGATGTVVTGGAITVEGSNSVGALKVGSTVTANNRFSEGDYLQVFATPTTASATGELTVMPILRARYGT
jgi:hypothetical protein